MIKSLCLLFFCSFIFLFIGNTTINGQTKSRQKKPTKQKKQLSAEEKKILDEINKELEENRPSRFYVFVGEKIEVAPFQPALEKDEILMDSSFKAKYKVIENVFGDYDKDTIEFEVYDHYGIPPFSKYQNVLLFVSEYNGKLYHEKYQYFDVYKTKNGKWASCGDPYIFEEYNRKKLNPINLEFETPLVFNLNNYNHEYRKSFFKQPYFKVTGNQAECLKGTYVDELFNIKKNGVLKARKIF